MQQAADWVTLRSQAGRTRADHCRPPPGNLAVCGTSPLLGEKSAIKNWAGAVGENKGKLSCGQELLVAVAFEVFALISQMKWVLIKYEIKYRESL